jgi:hypothetical protein
VHGTGRTPGDTEMTLLGGALPESVIFTSENHRTWDGEWEFCRTKVCFLERLLEVLLKLYILFALCFPLRYTDTIHQIMAYAGS